MRKPIDGPILYLDYDGVLHPGEVYPIRGQIVLRCDGIGLFEWAPLLAEYLEPYPYVRIVSSTSLVRVLSFFWSASMAARGAWETCDRRYVAQRDESELVVRAFALRPD